MGTTGWEWDGPSSRASHFWELVPNLRTVLLFPNYQTTNRNCGKRGGSGGGDGGGGIGACGRDRDFILLGFFGKFWSA